MAQKIGARQDDYLLIGTYPSGNVLGLKNFQVSRFLSVKPKIDIRYLESQSLISASGYTFVGLYPFGEVFVLDELNNNLEVGKPIRLFSGPPINQLERTPYHDIFMSVIETKSGESTIKDEYYQAGLHPDLLGQRVPTGVVLDGKVCFSTGNFTFLRPNDDVIAQITNLEEYGRVHCMSIPNQALVSTKEARIQINLHQRGFYIYSDERLIKKVAFDNLSLPLER